MTFQKFYTDTQEGRFIKSVLNNTELPNCHAVGNSGYMVKGIQYVNNSGIIRCFETGNKDEAVYRIIKPYIFGMHIDGFTNKYSSKHDYYDTETHERLGDYLRFYRDYYGIDLLPLYNCFSGRYIDNISISSSSVEGFKYERNANSRIASIPIKFNEWYTISISTDSPLFIKSAFHDGNDMVRYIDSSGVEKFSTQLLNNNYISAKSDYLNITDKINNPTIYVDFGESSLCSIKYKISLDNDIISDDSKKKLLDMEKYLKLFVQIPNDFNSPIVVIEGEYDNSKKPFNVFSMEDVDSMISSVVDNKIDFINSNLKTDSIKSSKYATINRILELSDDKTKNMFLCSKTSLQDKGLGESPAFSNRLVEYLTYNAVTSEDELDENIIKLQEAFGINESLHYVPSAWDDRIRYMLYSISSGYDSLGYMDKDCEKILTEQGRWE